MPLGLKSDFKMQFLERKSLKNKYDMHMNDMVAPNSKILKLDFIKISKVSTPCKF
jgi:CRISPR/Cas system CMR-associated protein Cmr1 (group 7 of RAMP superfamily)